MIGIDTNIVVRLVARDDERQFRKVENLFGNAGPRDRLVLNFLVFAESVWVLENQLKLPMEKVRSTMQSLVEMPEIEFPPTTDLTDWRSWLASDFQNFSDVVIASLNTSFGCDFTYTFDKRAARDVPGMKLLK